MVFCVISLIVAFLCLVIGVFSKAIEAESDKIFSIFRYCFLLIVILLTINIGNMEPTAMDVYQGMTELEYTVKNGEIIDSVVVFKNK